MKRLILPSRRAGTRIKIEHAGHKYPADDQCPEGKVAEVFCNSPEVAVAVGADKRRCIILSLLLQHGMTMVTLLNHLAKSAWRQKRLDRHHRRWVRLRERAQHWN